MLKFFLLSFLLLGLSVSGEMNEDTEVATLAADVNLNEKVASQEVSLEDSNNEESSEEEDNDEEDDSGAVEELASEDDSESEEQDDDAGARGRFRFRCKHYRGRRILFFRKRGACHRCLRGHRCRRVCRAYHNAHRRNYRRCRFSVRRAQRIWNIRLKRNWRKLIKVIRAIQRHYAAIRYLRRRIRRKNRGYIWRKRLYHLRRYHFWRRRYHFRIRAYNRLNWRLRRNWRSITIWRRKRNSATKKRVLNHLYARRRALFAARRRNRRTWRGLRKKMRFHLARYRYWHRRLYFNKQIHAHFRVIRRLNKKRAYHLRRRRYLWKRRRAAAIGARRRCAKNISHLRRRCVLCRGYCGRVCWGMHFSHARMVVSAHHCHMKRMLCHRRWAYRRAGIAWTRRCSLCMRRRNRATRKLVCGATCGHGLRYRLLSRFYFHQCRRF